MRSAVLLTRHVLWRAQAREAVEMRAQVEKKMAQKEKEKKEEKLRELAQMARDRRAGIKSHGDKGASDAGRRSSRAPDYKRLTGC